MMCSLTHHEILDRAGPAAVSLRQRWPQEKDSIFCYQKQRIIFRNFEKINSPSITRYDIDFRGNSRTFYLRMRNSFGKSGAQGQDLRNPFHFEMELLRRIRRIFLFSRIDTIFFRRILFEEEDTRPSAVVPPRNRPFFFHTLYLPPVHTAERPRHAGDQPLTKPCNSKTTQMPAIYQMNILSDVQCSYRLRMH